MYRRDFLKSATCAIGFGLFNPVRFGFTKDYDFDLLFQDAFVFDGTGKDGFIADVGITGERISAIGDLKSNTAQRIVNVEDHILCPGFIDIHSHSDDELLVSPFAESKVLQGVTTEIIGQDGKSVAPLSPDMRAELDAQYRSTYNLSVDWHNFYGYFRRLQNQGISVNLGTMIGQGTLRQFVVGRENSAAEPIEIKAMKRQAEQALADGALGISSGLEYSPGAFASSEEIVEICKAMNFAYGIYATHMRNEADFVMEALEEAIAVAQDADVALHISHLKCMGRRNWSKTEQILERITKARQRGVSITMDRYPYTAYNTNISSLFPVWSRSGTHGDFIKRLESPDQLPKIREETLDKIRMIGSWDAIMITAVESQRNKHLEGKRIPEVTGTNDDEFEFVRQLIVDEGAGVEMCGFAMSEKNTAEILSNPNCMIASDSSARSIDGVLNKTKSHPRTFGTFPRVFSEYVRKQNALTFSEAIRKMTNLPATKLGLKNRGLVREDYFADLVVFNPETIRDNATFADPHQYPNGINFVMVNGVPVAENGTHLRTTPGRILKRGHIPQNY